MTTQPPYEPPQWDVPGWDWEPHDHAWLSSASGIYKDGTSIFFIHGGRIRHQAHLPPNDYTVDEFFRLIAERAEGLDNPRVVWSQDTGDGDSGLWVEGTRPPNSDDLARLQTARERQARNDATEARALRQRHPEWFADGGAA